MNFLALVITGVGVLMQILTNIGYITDNASKNDAQKLRGRLIWTSIAAASMVLVLVGSVQSGKIIIK